MTTAYWWKGAPNFGDALAPFLIERFSNVKVNWAPIADASIASVGSILEHIPARWSGLILGSGKLKEASKLNDYTYTAKILALRGPLTAKHFPKGNFAIGDPGLLADELVGPQEKKWDLGIVAHWRDKELVPRFLKIIRPPSTTKVIDPGDDPLEVIRQIGSCRRIVTSSLHGMIVADAFGIPRRVEVSPALDREGGDFKFKDYSASILAPFIPGKMFEPIRWHVEDAKFEIYDAYRELENWQ